MKHVKRFVIATLLAATASAIAQQAPKPEAVIKWRQSVYQVLAWNSSRIKANLDGQFNREEVLRAATSTAAIANSGLGALYAPGTEEGKGWHPSAAKPEIFKDGKKVGDLAASFTREANELAKVAANGDQAAVKAQFGKLGQTCKACHDDYKSKD